MRMWQASFWFDGKQRHLGYFAEEEDAARAYDVRAYEVHGEYAYQNFPGLDIAA